MELLGKVILDSHFAHGVELALQIVDVFFFVLAAYPLWRPRSLGTLDVQQGANELPERGPARRIS